MQLDCSSNSTVEYKTPFVTLLLHEKNVFCAWRNTLLEDEKTVNINLDFFVKNGEDYLRLGESFKEKAYTDEELTFAVEDAGFKVLSRFSESTFDVPTDETERVTYIVGRSDYFG